MIVANIGSSETNNVRESKMNVQANQYDVYVNFLLECKDILADLDIEKLATDEAYKADFYNLITLSSDSDPFYIDNYGKDLEESFQASLSESSH
jgi:hypothetical protein